MSKKKEKPAVFVKLPAFLPAIENYYLDIPSDLIFFVQVNMIKLKTIKRVTVFLDVIFIIIML